MPFNSKLRLLYLYRALNTFNLCYKNQSVYAVSGTSRCLFSDKYSVGKAYSCWMLNWWYIYWSVGFKELNICYKNQSVHVVWGNNGYLFSDPHKTYKKFVVRALRFWILYWRYIEWKVEFESLIFKTRPFGRWIPKVNCWTCDSLSL